MHHNVLQLISSSGFFGAENVVLELSSELKAAGHSVTVGMFKNLHNPNLELIEKAVARSLDTQIFECSGQLDLRALFKIGSYVRENGIDIVHSHGYKSNIYSVLSNLVNRRPLITTCHNWINSNARMGLYSRLDKLFLKRFNAVISVSTRVRETLKEAGIKEEKIFLIENGINISRFADINNSALLRRKFGIADGSRVIGTVGRLSKEKGHTFFLKMAKDVLMKDSSCSFLIVGDGPLRSELEDEAKSLGLTQRLFFAGKQYNIPALLSIMDVFVLPSLTEGQPMALFEAMAGGKAVVATDVGDVSKILEGGELGVVVPSGNHEALANGVNLLVNDSEKAMKMGSMARDEVVRRYSSARMANDYIQVYDRLHRGSKHG